MGKHPDKLYLLSRDAAEVTGVWYVAQVFCRLSASDSLGDFFSLGLHTFDFCIIIIAGFTLFAEVILEIRDSKLELLNGLTALRLARVVAVVPTIKNILAMALASWANIINAWVFFIIWMSMFAVCTTYWLQDYDAIPALDDHGAGISTAGASGHRRSGSFDHGSTAKFDDYEHSLVTLFQVLFRAPLFVPEACFVCMQ